MDKKQKDKELTTILNKISDKAVEIYTKLSVESNAPEKNNVCSLNASINVKICEACKIKNHKYVNKYEFIQTYYERLEEDQQYEKGNINRIIYEFSKCEIGKKYIDVFLERYYYRHENTLKRTKVKDESQEIWFGDNKHRFGLLIAPVYRGDYKGENKKWENDKSEIRKAQFSYYTIEHILATGIVSYNNCALINLRKIEEITDFCKEEFYKNSNSIYEKRIWEKYFKLLQNIKKEDYGKISFLIPELRYNNEDKHKYRVDFAVFDVERGNYGYELSPLNHAITPNIESKTYLEIINCEKDKYHREHSKVNEMMEKYSMQIKTYSYEMLQDISKCFNEMLLHILTEDLYKKLQEEGIIHDILNSSP